MNESVSHKSHMPVFASIFVFALHSHSVQFETQNSHSICPNWRPDRMRIKGKGDFGSENGYVCVSVFHSFSFLSCLLKSICQSARFSRSTLLHENRALKVVQLIKSTKLLPVDTSTITIKFTLVSNYNSQNGLFMPLKCEM